MDNEELIKRLKEIDTEDFIWIIYIGIIFFSFFSNYFERIYLIYNDERFRKKYRNSLKIIFSILLVIYLYFLRNSISDLKNISKISDKNKKKLIFLSFLSALFIAMSGFILLYIAFVDEDTTVEIAFN